MTERRDLPLDQVRADGWFERLGEGAPHFEQLCDAVGDKVVAFAVVAGVRIASVAVDRRVPDASTVEFTLGEETRLHSLALGELRRRLATTLAEEVEHPETLPDDPSVELLQHFIGFRTLLLAPLFGIGLQTLCYGGDSEPTVWITRGSEREEVTLRDLRTSLQHDVIAEARTHGSSGASPFAIDLEVVPQAQAAADQRDWERVVDLLSAWPGPLSMLLRTGDGQALAPEVKSTLVTALGLLGWACSESGRGEWGDEVLRLGIQWGQDLGGVTQATLFVRLGTAQFRGGRSGQAIGTLRRALALGADERDVLPILAESYQERGRNLAAIVCAENAIALGLSSEKLDRVCDECGEALGEAWTKYRERVAAPSCTAPTRPPAGGAGEEHA